MFAKSYLQHDKANANKINKQPLPQYFEEFMRRRQAITAKTHQGRMEVKFVRGKKRPLPQNELGYLNLPKANFAKMVRVAKSKEDLELLKDAYYNFLGHRNLIPQVTLDKFMMKGLELEHPEALFEMIKFHSELLYHP